MAALPDSAPAKPQQPRKVLVLGQGRRIRPLVDSARGQDGRGARHEDRARGRRRSPTIRRTSTTQNLKQYDAIFLASTTGAFLDDPNDAAATAARRKALLEFVRGGKGLAGIHAATDSYHAQQHAGGRARRAWRRRSRRGSCATPRCCRPGGQEQRSEAESRRVRRPGRRLVRQARSRQERQGRAGRLHRALRVAVMPAPRAWRSDAGAAPVPQGRDTRSAPGRSSTR